MAMSEENLREEYTAYLGRMQELHPHTEPMSVDGFVDAYELWDSEYARAWEANDHDTVRCLEEMLCV